MEVEIFAWHTGSKMDFGRKAYERRYTEVGISAEGEGNKQRWRD